jgi:cell division protein FtsI (penicillin-binding protein 3)
LIKNLGLPGIYFEEEERRIYPYGNIFSHLIGYVNRENKGLAGLEKSYDEFLQNQDDKTPLKLTLDSRLQSIVNEEIDKAIDKFSAEGGSAVIIDPNNGEILAAISKPDFNPHFPGNAKDEELFNNYALGVYELGSIMKMPNVAIGLDSKKVTMYDAYDTSSLRVANFDIRDVHRSRGWHSLPQIFLHSSNIGMAQIVMDIGKEDYQQYIEKLGFTKKLDIEIPERGAPIVQKYDRWSDLTMATLSYGYALSISPLHFLNAAIPIVNGGYSHHMHFVKKDKIPEGTRVLDEETSINMRKLLRLAVEKGTAKNSNVKGYLVSGKTGTAEKVIDGKYAKNKARRSSFISVFPANNPKYIIFMMLDNPKPTKETFGYATAGWTVAPSIKNIIARMVALYGISPYDESDIKIKQQLHVDYEIGAEA